MTGRRASGHSPAAAALDPARLCTYVGDDPGAQLRFLQTFVVETRRSVDKIASSLTRAELDQARYEAHKLKPAAMVVGAQRLAQLCSAIELSAPDNGYMPILASQLCAETLLVQAGVEAFLNGIEP